MDILEFVSKVIAKHEEYEELSHLRPASEEERMEKSRRRHSLEIYDNTYNKLLSIAANVEYTTDVQDFELTLNDLRSWESVEHIYQGCLNCLEELVSDWHHPSAGMMVILRTVIVQYKELISIRDGIDCHFSTMENHIRKRRRHDLRLEKLARDKRALFELWRKLDLDYPRHAALLESIRLRKPENTYEPHKH